MLAGWGLVEEIYYNYGLGIIDVVFIDVATLMASLILLLCCLYYVVNSEDGALERSWAVHKKLRQVTSSADRVQ